MTVMPSGYAPIDYAAVRASIPLSFVLELLEFEPRSVRGIQHRGGCLLPDCEGVDFSANLDRNIWHCFSCRRGGNQLDLWARLHTGAFYVSTEHLCELAGIPVPRLPQPPRSTPRPATD
jgi:hypothetical protein